MLVVSFVGGRPNLIKVEPVHRGLDQAGINHVLIDVGVYSKHYGPQAFQDLDLPVPSQILEATPNLQNYISTIKDLSSKIINALKTIKPDVVLVYGDIDPSVAAVIATAQVGIPVMHVEAGLRNYDVYDTEEVNRLIIDRFSSVLLTTCKTASENLFKEGISEDKVHLIGNPMVDVLKRHLSKANSNRLQSLGLEGKQYGLVTIHRNENLSSPGRLDEIIEGIWQVEKNVPLVFIQYASTLKAFEKYNLQFITKTLNNVHFLKTLPYHEYLGILKNATFILTDSSGLQDETSYLGIPCLTCRNNTHRISTVTFGTNKIVGANASAIVQGVEDVLGSSTKEGKTYPDEWDISVGEEVVKAISIEVKVV